VSIGDTDEEDELRFVRAPLPLLDEWWCPLRLNPIPEDEEEDVDDGVEEDNLILGEDPSSAPNWLQIWAKRAKGLLLASSW